MPPTVHPSCFIHEAAVIIGDVTLLEGCSVWPGAVIRGDENPIVIGRGSNIQDNCVVHVDADNETVIGENVTLGHGAVVHGAKLGDDVLVGMNATVLSGAVIGRGSLIGACTLVKQGMSVPDGSLVLGIPGKIVKEGDEGLLDATTSYSSNYKKLRDMHKAGTFESYKG